MSHRFALVLLLSVLVTVARAVPIPVPPRAPIVDLAGVLAAPDAQRLEQKVLAHGKATGHGFGVVTLKSLDGEPLETFAHRVITEWKLGQPGNQDGAVILLATGERKVRVQVSRGLSARITAAVAEKVAHDTMSPLLKAGKAADALGAGLDELARLSHLPVAASAAVAPAAAAVVPPARAAPHAPVRAPASRTEDVLGQILAYVLVIGAFSLVFRKSADFFWTFERDGTVKGAAALGPRLLVVLIAGAVLTPFMVFYPLVWVFPSKKEPAKPAGTRGAGYDPQTDPRSSSDSSNNWTSNDSSSYASSDSSSSSDYGGSSDSGGSSDTGGSSDY